MCETRALARSKILAALAFSLRNCAHALAYARAQNVFKGKNERMRSRQ